MGQRDVPLCPYGDIIGPYEQGSIRSMLDGNMGFWGPLPASQGILLFIAIFMTPPCVMVFLSLALRSALNRWFNIILGVFYTAFALILFVQAFDRPFFAYLSAVEAVLTGLLVWYAVRWPRERHET